MTDSHEDEWVARLPEGAFDLMEELARWRELRDVVMPADLVARMDRATAELTARQIVTQVAAVGSRAAGGLMATRSSLAGPDIQFHSGPVLFLDEGLRAPKVHGTAVLLSTLESDKPRPRQPPLLSAGHRTAHPAQLSIDRGGSAQHDRRAARSYGN